jgi:hypothetical protein
METHTIYQVLVQGDTQEGELPCGWNIGIINDFTGVFDKWE